MSERFPVLQAIYNGHKLTVPLALVQAHARQAEANHYQSVERLAQRGGLSWAELAAVLDDRPFAKMTNDEAHEAVMRHVICFLDRAA